jgi:hypothetical protein
VEILTGYNEGIQRFTERGSRFTTEVPCCHINTRSSILHRAHFLFLASLRLLNIHYCFYGKSVAIDYAFYTYVSSTIAYLTALLQRTLRLTRRKPFSRPPQWISKTVLCCVALINRWGECLASRPSRFVTGEVFLGTISYPLQGVEPRYLGCPACILGTSTLHLLITLESVFCHHVAW